MSDLLDTYHTLVAMPPRERKEQLVTAYCWGFMPEGEARFWFNVFRLGNV